PGISTTGWAGMPCGVATGASGCAGVGWLAGVAWLVVPASSLALANGYARLAIAALSLCLQKPCGALGKSGQLHVPFTTKYSVVPLRWLATVAVPSGNKSTSPARTIATAFSMRPLTAS